MLYILYTVLLAMLSFQLTLISQQQNSPELSLPQQACRGAATHCA